MDALGLARVATLGALAALASLHGARAASAAPDARTMTVVADRDDDDRDGVADGEQAVLTPLAHADLVPLDPALVGEEVEASGDGAVRVIVAERPWPMKRPVPAGALLQGVRPGAVRLAARSGKVAVSVSVVGLDFMDAQAATVDASKAHASLERTPPARVEESADDPDAVRVRVSLPTGVPDVPGVMIESIGNAGVSLDTLHEVAMTPVACRDPAALGVRCFATVPLRLVVDDVDRTHPLVVDRSLRGEVGGALVARLGGRRQVLRVEGLRASEVGPIGRLRATLRPIVVRISAGGAPAIGGNDVGAIAQLRAELAVASATWGQCGLSFGDAQSIEVRVVDPPTSHLVSFGDDAGLPAAGGEVRVRVEGAPLTAAIPAGASLERAAMAFALAATRAGFAPTISSNPRVTPGAAGSVDVSLRKKDGALATVEAIPGTSTSTDPVLSVRVGSVDLADGLQHFGDMDSMAGTLEERTLVKALDDGNPQTIEIIIVPFFSGSGRIGESFIGVESPSMGNVVLMDRAGVRARKSSLALPHELGHVLLDMPGHPDDYGVDTPTLLMDSDASDASPFGPRRLTVAECARALRESGPSARVPLLSAWPLKPLKVK